MLTQLTLIILLLSYGQSTTLSVEFTDANYSSYAINLNGEKWLSSGMTGFRSNNKWSSLQLYGTQTSNGTDSLGEYNDFNIIWNKYQFITTIRSYPSNPEMVIFIQSYPNGTEGSANISPDYLVSSFPSFLLNNDNLGYIQWAGDFGGYYTRIGKWNSDPSNEIPKGGFDYGDGPICIFDKNIQNALVVSPLTYHMSASSYVSAVADPYYEIEFGLIGKINAIEKGFSISWIVTAAPNGGGVNAAMKSWGDKQLKYYNKRRGTPHLRDYTLQYLGYSTDNGCYYYYWTEPGKDYQNTLFDVKKYHDSVGLPTKYILLDSWWYYQGEYAGVYNWSAMPQVFPDGLQAVYQQTGWKIQAHNRMWSLDNVYASNIQSNSSGQFEFTWGDKSALPMTESFWDYLFDINMDWGLVVYEQDWLLTSMQEVPLLSNTTWFGRQWLKQMDNAAFRHDLSIQYCMDITRYLMSTVELKSVTQARVSGDYHPGNDQWQIGITAIFAAAVDIAPSKDSFWSLPIAQSGHYENGTSEPYNRLQSAVLSLSNGPITFGDRVGYSNVALIMKCCSKSGLILRPDSAATMIDEYFKMNAFNSSELTGEIWVTYSEIGNEMFRYIYVFGVLLTKDFEMYPKSIEYYLGNGNDKWLVYEANTTAEIHRFDNDTALTIRKGNKYEFQLYTLIPIGNNNNVENGWYLQGEIHKWITVSNQRFTQITRNSNGEIFVVIAGSVNETVYIAFVKVENDALTQEIINCTVGETEQMIIKMPLQICDAY